MVFCYVLLLLLVLCFVGVIVKRCFVIGVIVIGRDDVVDVFNVSDNVFDVCDVVVHDL